MQANSHTTNILDEHEFVFLEELGRVLRKSRVNLYPLFRAGHLTPLKLGGRTVVKSAEVRAYLDNLPVATLGAGHEHVA